MWETDAKGVGPLKIKNNENERTNKYLYGSTKDKKKESHDETESRKKTLDEVRLMKNPGRVLCTARYVEKDFQVQCCVLVA